LAWLVSYGLDEDGVGNQATVSESTMDNWRIRLILIEEAVESKQRDLLDLLAV